MNALEVMSALCQSTRMNVVSLLVKAGADGMAAGALADATGSSHNTMSAHLAILFRAGLVESEKQGRSVVYRAKVEAVRKLAAFLQDVADGRLPA